MKTLHAFVKGARLAYLAFLGGGAAVFVVPGLGYDQLAARFGGESNLLRAGVGLCLFACCWEFARSSILRRNQAYIARRLQQTVPGTRRLEAVRILIPALNSDNESVAKTAYRELRRLTGVDLGTESRPWRDWLREQES